MVITMREVLLCNPEGSKVRLLPKLSLDLDTEDIAEKVRRRAPSGDFADSPPAGGPLGDGDV